MYQILSCVLGYESINLFGYWLFVIICRCLCVRVGVCACVGVYLFAFICLLVNKFCEFERYASARCEKRNRNRLLFS